jgi:hypothetical protein
VTDKNNYRNLARLRPAYHSSSYDYNLTAQLVTDGIITREMPDNISFSTNKGELPKNEREWLLDNNSVTEVDLSGNDVWLQLGINPGKAVPEVSRINLSGSLEYTGNPAAGWQFTCTGSDDGITWTVLGKVSGTGLPGEERKNPFAALFAKPKGSVSGKRPVNPFASFFSGPHPSMAIYVGRNEGNPPVELDTALRAMIHELHPDLHYISNSAFGVVSGGGPYRALPVRDYFLL